MAAFAATILICLAANTPTAQEFLPSPPADRTSIYILDGQNKLVPLPFEQGQTPLHISEVAKNTKISYIELKGEHAVMTVRTDAPQVFLFFPERQGVHPPFIVWLTLHHGTRRVVAIGQKGMRGFAIDSAQIVKPKIRVLAKNGDQVFAELSPRGSLIPGEYAIIGDDLARIATFRIVSAAAR